MCLTKQNFQEISNLIIRYFKVFPEKRKSFCNSYSSIQNRTYCICLFSFNFISNNWKEKFYKLNSFRTCLEFYLFYFTFFSFSVLVSPKGIKELHAHHYFTFLFKLQTWIEMQLFLLNFVRLNTIYGFKLLNLTHWIERLKWN